MPARALKMLLNQSPVGAAIGKIPGVRGAYKNLAWRHPHFVKSYFGVYRTHAEAAAQAFENWPLGWDNDAAYFSEWEQPSVYASMYWLSTVLKPGATLVEFGGHFGGAYRTYIRRQPLPDGAEWIVVELPAVVKMAAEKVALAQPSPLSFRTEFRSLPKVDVFFSAGSIQYLDLNASGIAAMITERRPHHVILNNFALTERPGFWSLQHLGGAMAPNQIFNEEEFFSAFADAGYGLCDRWDVAELNCQIPFEPSRHVKSFAGVCFERIW
jgi:putative methyltransferase (TIGR04325 family)